MNEEMQTHNALLVETSIQTETLPFQEEPKINHAALLNNWETQTDETTVVDEETETEKIELRMESKLIDTWGLNQIQ